MKLKNSLVLLPLAALLSVEAISQSNNFPVTYKTIKVDWLDIFYCEPVVPSKPTILLYHVFPSSSHMYRDLINDLSFGYHLIAPDFPGFGESSQPSTSAYNYTFDQLSKTIDQFIDQLKIKKLSLYVQ